MKKILKLTFLTIFVCYIIFYYQINENKTENKRHQKQTNNLKTNKHIKKVFEEIYKFRKWTNSGDGSGIGSSIDYTENARNIIFKVIQKYKLNSILDAPCGSMSWMPILLKNLSILNSNFKYHGLDIVESVITKSNLKYGKENKNWLFSVYDVSEGDLPSNYDLILSRDALQHLPFQIAIKVLKSYALTKNSNYLLIGSYKSKQNRNITIGDYYRINLMLPPFNLNNFTEIFFENDLERKHLILYDIRNYLSKINFEQMKLDASQFKEQSFNMIKSKLKDWQEEFF
jgi:hypothetical protein